MADLVPVLDTTPGFGGWHGFWTPYPTTLDHLVQDVLYSVTSVSPSILILAIKSRDLWLRARIFFLDWRFLFVNKPWGGSADIATELISMLQMQSWACGCETGVRGVDLYPPAARHQSLRSSSNVLQCATSITSFHTPEYAPKRVAPFAMLGRGGSLCHLSSDEWPGFVCRQILLFIFLREK